MFAASLMVCSLVAGNPTFKDDQCAVFDDTLGPYHTEMQCIGRVEEMLEIVPGLFLPPYQVYYRCERKTGV